MSARKGCFVTFEGIEGVGHYRNNRRPPRVVIAPDKFRGTATAGEVAAA